MFPPATPMGERIRIQNEQRERDLRLARQPVSNGSKQVLTVTAAASAVKRWATGVMGTLNQPADSAPCLQGDPAHDC